MTGRVKFADAAPLAGQLAGLLSRRRVEIDLSALEETDAATLQVLVAARRSARKAGQDLGFRLAPAGPVTELIERLGLTPHLSAGADQSAARQDIGEGA